MDSNSIKSAMEFLDLSDANDDEKAEAMAIIGSGPLNGVEFPFEYKSITNEILSEAHESVNCSQTVDPELCQSMIECRSLNTSPNLRHESSPALEFVSHSSEQIQTSNSLPQWEMSAPNGGPVVCAPPQYIYHQTPPHYYATNAPMAGPYFSPVPNGVPNKMRPSGSGPNGKSGKPIHSPDIRAPFYTPPNQYSEGPQLIDGSRAPPTAIVSDGMVTLTNQPSVQPMFTPGYPHTFLSHPHHSPFPAQMYIIATPEGSYLTYGLPTTGVQMPRPSSPLSVPNVVNTTDDNSSNICEVPLNGGNGSGALIDEQLIGDSDEPNEEVVFESNDNIDNNENIETENQKFRENNSIINDSKGEEVVNVCDNNENNQIEISSELSNDCPQNDTIASSNSTDQTPNTSSGNVWSSSQKTWADLFKASSSASIHSSINSSNPLSSQTSSVLAYGSVNHSYNNLNLTERDSHLNSSAISCESETRIECIPMRNDSFATKLAKRVKQLGLKHSLPYLIPSGFVNRSNWCYINATLQALVGCPPFYNLMREIGETSGIFRDRSSTPIIDSFAKFFTHFNPCEHLTKKQKSGVNMTSEDIPKGEPIEPRCIYDVLGSIKSECLKGRQEDAEEFLSSVLNGLHEEMIALFSHNEKKSLNGQHLTANGHIGREENGDHFADIDDNDDANLWKEVSSRHKPMPTRSARVISTPIFDIFGGLTLSVRTAGKDICGNRQPFFALQLDIQSDKVKSVEDALKCLTTSESIQGYMCPKTKQAMDASAQTFLDTLPPVLILHLKLFVYDMDGGGGCRKLMKRIEYPVDLELPRECLHYDKWEREKNLQLKRYKLLSVVYHDGAEAIKGHYVTDVYHIGSNQWLRCDDGSVKVISTQKVLNTDTSRTPYLLFYRRHDTLYGKNIVLSNNSKPFSH